MERLERSKFTAAGEIANERLVADGREIVAAPRGGLLASSTRRP
jgi:hypothetical protein